MPEYCPEGHPLPGGPLGAICPTCLSEFEARAGCPSLPGLLLTEKIGSGGMGDVYLGSELGTHKLIAVKVLAGVRADPVAQDRFHCEFRAVMEVNHSNVVRVYRHEVTDEVAWFTMDYIEGKPLAKHLESLERNSSGRPWSADARRFTCTFLAIADGITHAHAAGVFHQDLKPSNVMVRENDQPVIIDFGCSSEAREAHPLLGRQGRYATPGYLPPEFLETGKAPPATLDIYAIGVMLHEFLAGRRPDQGPPPQYPGLTDLWAVTRKCLAPAAKRYGTMAEVRDELQRVHKLIPTRARRASWLINVAFAIRRHPTRTFTSLLLVAFAVASLSFGLHQQAQSQRDADALAARRVADEMARRVNVANAAADRGRWSQALANYDDALAGDPADRPQVCVRRWQCLFGLGRLADLEAELSAAATDPQLSDVHADMALLRGEIALTDKERTAEGNVLVRTALTTAPSLDSADAAYARGLIADNVAAAEAEFRSAVTLRPTHHRAQGALVGISFFTGRRDEARRQAAFITTLFPDHPLSHLITGMAAIQNDAVDAGLAAIRNAADRMPVEKGKVVVAYASAFARVHSKAKANQFANGGDTLLHLVLLFGELAGPTAMAIGAKAFGLPQPLAAHMYDTGTVYFDASFKMLDGKFDEALMRVEPALTDAPDAALLVLAAGLHMARVKHLAFKPNDQPDVFWPAVAKAAAYAERASTAPTMFPAGSFNY